MSATQLHDMHSMGAESGTVHLRRRIREKTVAVAWMREYIREEREPSVAPKYLQKAIADFEAQLETMDAQLRHLTPTLTPSRTAPHASVLGTVEVSAALHCRCTRHSPVHPRAASEAHAR
jgi:hypothetical protein